MHESFIDPARPEAWAAIVSRLGGSGGIDASARLHGAFRRSRRIRSAEDLLRLVLAYAPGGRSLRVTAAEAAAGALADVSDVALLGRFRRCGDWLAALCGELLAGRARPAPGGGGPRVRVIDGSRIEGPGKTCLRLHLCYDAGRQRIADFAITALCEGERLDLVGVGPGEVAVADRGYPQPEGLRAVRARGADLLVRLTWNSLHLRGPCGEALDWPDLLDKAGAAGGLDMPVAVHKVRGRFEPLPLRLVIAPKPPLAAEKARAAARRAASKDQRRIDPRTLAAAGHMILITSLEAAAFPPQRLLDLYRVRWQVELAFKRLKSILRLDRLPAKDPGLARAWVAAHLLFALLIEDMAADMAGFPPSGP